MPLSFQESKNLMVKMFRLALAASERRSEDAVRTFSDIVDSTFAGPLPNFQAPHVFPFQTTYRAGQQDEDGISTISRTSSNDMPPLVPLDAKVDNGYDYFGIDKPVAEEEGVKLVISEAEADEAAADEDDEAEAEAKAEDDEADEEADEEEADEEVDEADEEEAEEEEEELQLVPVRIKKVTYWKDELSGDIYQYLPDDECGDKVGTYVDGKAVFD
jgi:hypothetical protein